MIARLAVRVPEVHGVDDVAVVGHGNRPQVRRLQHRLNVLRGVRAAGGVAAVADGEMSMSFRQGVAAKYLRDQSLVLDGVEVLAVSQRDAGALLPAVLHGV